MEEGRHISQDCPIKVELLKATEWGKGGMWTVLLNLTLVNTSADPRWLLVGRGFNKPLKEEVETWRVETGYFKSQKDVKFVYFYSSPGVTAFLLPGSGQIILESWDMDTVHPEVETLYVWQVEKIVVNGSESILKTWLLVDFQCPVSAFVIEANDQMPTHFHKIREGKAGKVRFVGIEKKWAIQVFDPIKG